MRELHPRMTCRSSGIDRGVGVTKQDLKNHVITRRADQTTRLVFGVFAAQNIQNKALAVILRQPRTIPRTSKRSALSKEF